MLACIGTGDLVGDLGRLRTLLLPPLLAAFVAAPSNIWNILSLSSFSIGVIRVFRRKRSLSVLILFALSLTALLCSILYEHFLGDRLPRLALFFAERSFGGREVRNFHVE
jgi:hypothetical protein